MMVDDGIDTKGSDSHSRGIGVFLVCVAFLGVLVLFGSHVRLYYWLCDDAFISFRYARNLVNGDGLVFNRGERVEGYTNFLWILELAGIWKILGMRPEVSCTVVSVLYTIGTLGVSVLLAMGTPFRDRWR